MLTFGGQKLRGVLVLEDGTTYQGVAFGAPGEFFGEVCFNTSMTGYQEILTDPSYTGQMVNMTYPLIGNYGVNTEDFESDRVHMGGFIVRELSRLRSNWRSSGDLDGFLKSNGTVGLEGIDTRALTRRIRAKGAMKAALSTVDLDRDSLLARLEGAPGLVGRDMVREVTISKPYVWDDVTTDEAGDPRFEIVACDFGIKRNILRLLASLGCRVTVVPASATAEEILNLNPDGVFLSNGPGDPAAVTYAIDTVRALLGKKPIFGICLGHQLLGLALGGRTYKLKFGHRGANQPVMRKDTGRVEITAQNHGFAVDTESLAQCEYFDVELTHWNLNDMTSEGMRCEKAGAFSVQYHPKAAPGPHDSRYLFEAFLDLMKEWR
ncbi:MAG: carbamoyl phosphate synthase small subunit [Candidatus Anoxymicrobium japonicum]|uniref:Carbamoyl phosphate synthase small chain n=1 Tax=Candidatus Anoxymicrobium japonicum TaxID=2013648 RepID=A0A2N3G7M6_9ACTN|nr:MAG: carbamoyl phosphate synthase small subunit [Candidatus Anoxymicrobium japonicum]